jgi:hypothetical protein
MHVYQCTRARMCTCPFECDPNRARTKRLTLMMVLNDGYNDIPLRTRTVALNRSGFFLQGQKLF